MGMWKGKGRMVRCDGGHRRLIMTWQCEFNLDVTVKPGPAVRPATASTSSADREIKQCERSVIGDCRTI